MHHVIPIKFRRKTQNSQAHKAPRQEAKKHKPPSAMAAFRLDYRPSAAAPTKAAFTNFLVMIRRTIPRAATCSGGYSFTLPQRGSMRGKERIEPGQLIRRATNPNRQRYGLRRRITTKRNRLPSFRPIADGYIHTTTVTTRTASSSEKKNPRRCRFFRLTQSASLE